MQIELKTLSYDSDKERASMTMGGSEGPTKPISLTLIFPVPTPGDLPESQVRAAAKAKAKELLQAAAAAL